MDIEVLFVCIPSWSSLAKTKERYNLRSVVGMLVENTWIADACFSSTDRNANCGAHLLLGQTRSKASTCATVQAFGGPVRKDDRHGRHAGLVALQHMLSNTAKKNPQVKKILVVTESATRMEQIYWTVCNLEFRLVPRMKTGGMMLLKYRKETNGFFKIQAAQYRDDDTSNTYSADTPTE